MMLSLKEISFSYGEKQVFDRFSLCLKKGEILAIMGPSGCGKSTLLHIIAGLRIPDAGSIVSTAQRIAVAFQEPRLFPWLTVAENICAVLPKDAACESEIDRVLQLVGLSDCKTYHPSELSGGMKSRVSLARALAFGGDLLLLDEPFSALDEDMRLSLAQALRKQCKDAQISVILVTHNLSDAQAMADRIIRL